MRTTKLSLFLYALGLALSCAPPIIATLFYFPLWRAKGGIFVLSGLTLILLFLGAEPLFRIIREKLKSPSAPFIWLAVFTVFFIFSRIAEEVTVISFFGFTGNILGSLLFKLSDRKKDRDTEKQ